MSTVQIISSIIGLIIGCSIVWMVRKDHLITRDGLKWIFIAILIIVYGLFPHANDLIGSMLGIGYPPIIPVVVGFGIVLLKLLVADIERAKMQVTINRLVQKMSMMEAELKRSQKK